MTLLDVNYHEGREYHELFSIMIDSNKCEDTAVGMTNDGVLLYIENKLSNNSSAYWVQSVFYSISKEEFCTFLKQARERGYIEKAIKNGQTTEEELKKLSEWRTFTNTQELMFSSEDVIRMQEIVIKRIGGGLGILDYGLIESSVEAPFYAPFGDPEKYPSVWDKAARYATAFDKKQVFVDGNKRVAVSVMLGWLARNSYKCTLSNFALHELMMDLANNAIEDEADLAKILENNTIKTSFFEGMTLEKMVNALIDQYKTAYEMLGAGAGDTKIEQWKAAMIASGDNGNYR